MKKVIYIEDHVGPRGGEYWLLTLECGHIKYKYKPRFRIGFFCRGPITAPHSVRCWHCEGVPYE